MNLMLLCAGEGKRLRPFTLEKPKPAIPFLTVPLGFFGISLMESAGINHIIANHYYLPEDIMKVFSEPQLLHLKQFRFSEEKTLLGSGGGVHKAKKLILANDKDDSFMLMNGDEIHLPKRPGLIEDFIAFHRAEKNIASIFTIEHEDVGTKFGGVWVDADLKVLGFGKEKIQGSVQGLHYTGLILLSKDIFNYFKPEVFINSNAEPVLEENLLYDTLIAAALKGERIKAYKMDPKDQPIWFETGNPEDFLKATKFCISEIEKYLHKEEERPYHVEFLMQTIRLYGSRNRMGAELPLKETDFSFLIEDSDLRKKITDLLNQILG